MIRASAAPPEVVPLTRAVWEQALRQDPQAMATQTPGWLDAICAEGPWAEAGRLYRWDDGTRIVLPLVTHTGPPGPGSPELASWPTEWGVGGPLCPDGPPTSAHTAAVLADLADVPGRVRLRIGPLTAGPWAEAVPERAGRTPRTTHVVDLAGPAGAWRQRLHPGARRSMRKAARSGLDVTRGSTAHDLEVFYALYQQSMDRWATRSGEPADQVRRRIEARDPLRKLRTVRDRLGGACSVWTAWYRGEPAASVILLRQGRQAKYWRGAMSQPLAAPTRANHLLHELALQEAADAGCTHYHMGDSHPGGVTRFKESLGARPYPTPAYLLPAAPLTAR
ncbi:lipid II:glycine glycyltransferase FemX [Streptomyces sp. HF10]|uniref:lipid II:glycine glycyltransferase FemX n=1 Tax=Streptomyces sp. HF10 TaxID=2692233 RepID=UPI00131824BB|nr:GNAT family N-acetyltransferase [Streptomyces sp. HF10]QHC32660.1 GNAT family N-acetyltransferase [Streptomyces sp. HF10]